MFIFLREWLSVSMNAVVGMVGEEILLCGRGSASWAVLLVVNEMGKFGHSKI